MKTFIIVDLQNDFLPGGALPVKEGNRIIPVINQAMEDYDLILATKDWHPLHHKSFAVEHHRQPGEIIELNGIEQILWPVHCVQKTWGSEFPSDLSAEKISKIFYKGIDEDVDSYSAFFDNARKRGTGLDEYLKALNIKEITIAGLATDYCVKYSVLDACELGYRVSLLLPGCRGIDLYKGDVERALREMESAGAEI